MNLNLSMPKQYVDQLAKEAKETGLTKSEITRRALDVYLATKPEPK